MLSGGVELSRRGYLEPARRAGICCVGYRLARCNPKKSSCLEQRGNSAGVKLWTSCGSVAWDRCGLARCCLPRSRDQVDPSFPESARRHTMFRLRHHYHSHTTRRPIILHGRKVQQISSLLIGYSKFHAKLVSHYIILNCTLRRSTPPLLDTTTHQQYSTMSHVFGRWGTN